MASITITIPDDKQQRVLDAFCGSFSYNPAVDGSKGQFTKQQILHYVKEVVVRYESDAAASTARAATKADIALT